MSGVIDSWHPDLKSEESFSALTDLTTITPTTEHDFLLFRNPSGTVLNALVTVIYGSLNSSSARGVMKLYSAPTVGNVGTALTIVKNTIGAATNSVMEVYKNPTISARGTLMGLRVMATDSNDAVINRKFLVRKNTDILVTFTNSVESTASNAEISWLEVRA